MKVEVWRCTENGVNHLDRVKAANGYDHAPARDGGAPGAGAGVLGAVGSQDVEHTGSAPSSSLPIPAKWERY